MTPRHAPPDLIELIVGAALVVFIALILTGCGLFGPRPVQTIEVKVPVPVRVLPPAELYAPLPVTALPEWVGPLAPGAVSCLTAEGEQRLKALLLGQEARRQGLRAWVEAAPN